MSHKEEQAKIQLICITPYYHQEKAQKAGEQTKITCNRVRDDFNATCINKVTYQHVYA